MAMTTASNGTTVGVADWRIFTSSWRCGITLMCLMLALACFPMCQCAVMCNEFDTCLSAEKQLNLTQALRQNNREQVCTVASSAINCLEEARKDCDNGYKNLPEYIVKGLEDKKTNLTLYTATYCGTNGSDRLMTNMAAIFLWTTGFHIFYFA